MWICALCNFKVPTYLILNTYENIACKLAVVLVKRHKYVKHIALSSTCCYRHKMMSSNGNIFRVTGPLWGESIDHRWIPLTKSGDVERCFLWSAHEQTVEQTIETLVIWDASAFIMTAILRDEMTTGHHWTKLWHGTAEQQTITWTRGDLV